MTPLPTSRLRSCLHESGHFVAGRAMGIYAYKASVRGAGDASCYLSMAPGINDGAMAAACLAGTIAVWMYEKDDGWRDARRLAAVDSLEREDLPGYKPLGEEQLLEAAERAHSTLRRYWGLVLEVAGELLEHGEVNGVGRAVPA